MRVVMTGASGFVGHGLAEFLCNHPDRLGKLVSKLVLADLTPRDADQGLQGCEGAEWHCGNLTDAAYLDTLLKEPVDCFFHLASVPGSAAEIRARTRLDGQSDWVDGPDGEACASGTGRRSTASRRLRQFDCR